MPTYIVTEYGLPSVTEELRPYQLNRLAAMKASWSHCKAFDGTSRYQLQPEQRILAQTVYNPRADVRADWRITGECSLAEIMSEVEQGLQTDDDPAVVWSR